MGMRYGRLVFGPETIRRQEQIGSFVAYGAKLAEPDTGPDLLEPQVQGMIRAAHHFFLASVAPSGWPYIQHRGGPTGFVHVLDECILGFADYAGNRQFVTAGNLTSNDRVALFFIDYARRRRVKILGRATLIERENDPELLQTLARTGDAVAQHPERSILVKAEGVDVNCSRHIEPMWDRASVERTKQLYQQETAEAVAEAERLRRRVFELETQLSAIEDPQPEHRSTQ